MKATINCGHQSDGTVIEGKSLREIKRQLDHMLDVGGPRGLTATTDKGQAIHTSLYEGQDYIRTANGKIIRL